MKIRREAGFSLLEVVIAMGIFSIAALGVLGMVTTSMTLTANAKQSQESDLIANWAMEQFQALPVTDPNISGTASTNYWITGTGASLKNTTIKTFGMPELLAASTVPSTRYQVYWFYDTPGGNAKLRHYAIFVAWPRDRQRQTEVTPTIDCTPATSACFKYSYHSYRVVP